MISCLGCARLVAYSDWESAFFRRLWWLIEYRQFLLLLLNYSWRILLFLWRSVAIHELDTTSWNDSEILWVVWYGWSWCQCMIADLIYQVHLRVRGNCTMRVQRPVAYTLHPVAFNWIRTQTTTLRLLLWILFDGVRLLFVSITWLRVMSRVRWDPSICFLAFFIRGWTILRKEGNEAHVKRIGLLYPTGNCIRHLSQGLCVVCPNRWNCCWPTCRWLHNLRYGSYLLIVFRLCMISESFWIAHHLLNGLVLFTPEGRLVRSGIEAILVCRITLFYLEGLHLFLEQSTRGICSDHTISLLILTLLLLLVWIVPARSENLFLRRLLHCLLLHLGGSDREGRTLMLLILHRLLPWLLRLFQLYLHIEV